MQASHDQHCDESHTPRQACNEALAPTELRPAVEPNPIDAVPASMMAEQAAEEPASNAVREAVATTEMPRPTSYVTREWERTEAALAGAESNASDDDVAGKAWGGAARKIVMLVAVSAVVWAVLRMLRGLRTHEGPSLRERSEDLSVRDRKPG